MVLVCVFNEDQSVGDSFTTCTASPWSPPFATDPYLPALLEVRSSNGKMGSITEGKLDSAHSL
ncbi:unnamed protein product [Dibothriocephalus latus]|uniref:Uncharacterized protein n=1 Tax=Dibothriocephalus latus TaxID=60516 RepID=A0A3P7NMR6_DIBLA|nr:unnamed protein product [Dibothriocephalus latus]